MASKVAAVCLFLISGIGFAGDRNPTGVFRIDVINFSPDTVTAEASVIVHDPRRQNPIMNGLYSLLLPGAGQYQTERYTKGAIFLGAEVAFIAFAIISDHNGDKKTEEFQQYAEAHWSPERYAKWINVHGAADYGPAATIDLNKVRQNDFSEINAWESAPSPNKIGFSHQLPRFREQQYYELIGKYHQFKFGWDTYPDLNNDGVPDSDGRNYDAMIPQQLKDYAKERGIANDYYYAASFAASVLVINHFVSAIDAVLSTRSYNNDISASLQLTPVDGREGKRLMAGMKISVGL